MKCAYVECGYPCKAEATDGAWCAKHVTSRCCVCGALLCGGCRHDRSEYGYNHVRGELARELGET
jgi:hypothetical protein